MNLKLKMLGAAVVIAASAAAQAAPIYLDLGANYGGPGNKVGPTTTGVFDALTYKYNSKTTFTDTDGNGFLSVGDKVLGTGGTLKAAGLPSLPAAGFVTGIDPQAGGIGNPGGPSNNGFGGSWNLNLGWDNLVGTVNAVGGVDYSSGTIHLYFTDATNTAKLALDFIVSAGGNNNIAQSLDLKGTVVVRNGGDTIGLTGTLGDLFNFADGTSFADAVGDVLFSSNQNTSPFFVNGNPALGQTTIPANFYNAPGGTGVIEGEHDGSVTFAQEVPEPASLALLGLGLVGLAATRRRKSA